MCHACYFQEVMLAVDKVKISNSAEALFSVINVTILLRDLRLEISFKFKSSMTLLEGSLE